MGIYYYCSRNYTKHRHSYSKITELSNKKDILKLEYLKEPSSNTYIQILNLKKQINSINIKSKKKGKSKLRFELK